MNKEVEKLKKKNDLLLKIIWYFLALLIIIVAVALVGAQQESLPELTGDFFIGKNVTLQQLCASCSFVDISLVNYPDNTILISNVTMVKDGEYFSYVLDASLINQIGEYTVLGSADPSSKIVVWAYTFQVKDNNVFSILGLEKGVINGIIIGLLFLSIILLSLYRRFEVLGVIAVVLSIYFYRAGYINEFWGVIAIISSLILLGLGTLAFIKKQT